MLTKYIINLDILAVRWKVEWRHRALDAVAVGNPLEAGALCDVIEVNRWLLWTNSQERTVRTESDARKINYFLQKRIASTTCGMNSISQV